MDDSQRADKDALQQAVDYARIVVREADAKRFDAPKTEMLARGLIAATDALKLATRSHGAALSDAELAAMAGKLVNVFEPMGVGEPRNISLPEPRRSSIGTPVAWRYRQRLCGGQGQPTSNWGDWRHVPSKPQGPESDIFQIEPLFATPSASATSTADARWRFGVEHGWPTLHRRIHPDVQVLGWRMPSQNPPDGKTFDPDDYPYYKTAEEAIDAAMSRASDGGHAKP